MKFWRFRKKWFEAGLTFLVTVALGGCAWKGTAVWKEGRLLTKEEVREDRNQVIRYVEDVHPFFELEKDQTEYDETKKEYIEDTDRGMKVKDFQIQTSEYLTSLGESHTQITGESAEGLEFLSIDTEYENRKTYVCKDGKKTGVWIESIGGIAIEDIYRQVEKMQAIENEMDYIYKMDIYTRLRETLEACDVNIQGNRVEILFSNGEKKKYRFWKYQSTEPEGNRSYMEGDIFVVDFNSCVTDGEMWRISSKLESAVKNGCTKVIIDVRGNGGGDSNAGLELLKAMGMEPPEYSMVIRWSEELLEQRGNPLESEKKEIEIYKGALDCAKQNEKIRLVVLSDRNTFSSATMLCVWVRDGQLGKIVGEPSRNMPNAYGDLLKFTLENSKLDLYVSCKKFIRPDSSNEEDMLAPDVQTSSENACDKAVELLNHQ